MNQIPPIKIEMTPEQLDSVLLSVKELPPINGFSPANKAVRSLFEKVHEKLLKKQISKRKEPRNKVFKLSLDYHEAYALSEVLSTSKKLIGDMTYEYYACLSIENKIQERL